MSEAAGGEVTEGDPREHDAGGGTRATRSGRAPEPDDGVRATARRSRWATTVLTAGIGVAIALGLLEFVDGTLFWVGIAGTLVVFRLPAARLETLVRLRTDRAPEQVREALGGVDDPMLAPTIAHADEIERTEYGLRVTASGPLGLGGGVFEVVTEEREDVTTVELRQDGESKSTYDAEIARERDETRVVIRDRPAGRQSLSRLVALTVAWQFHRRALDHLGYEVERRDVSLSL